MTELIGEDYLETDRPIDEIIYLFSNSVRITLGWFFPENNTDENAIYWDYYFEKDGTVILLLDVDCEDGKLELPLCKINIAG